MHICLLLQERLYSMGHKVDDDATRWVYFFYNLDIFWWNIIDLENNGIVLVIIKEGNKDSNQTLIGKCTRFVKGISSLRCIELIPYLKSINIMNPFVAPSLFYCQSHIRIDNDISELNRPKTYKEVCKTMMYWINLSHLLNYLLTLFLCCCIYR